MAPPSHPNQVPNHSFCISVGYIHWMPVLPWFLTQNDKYLIAQLPSSVDPLLCWWIRMRKDEAGINSTTIQCLNAHCQQHAYQENRGCIPHSLWIKLCTRKTKLEFARYEVPFTWPRWYFLRSPNTYMMTPSTSLPSYKTLSVYHINTLLISSFPWLIPSCKQCCMQSAALHIVETFTVQKYDDSGRPLTCSITRRILGQEYVHWGLSVHVWLYFTYLQCTS